MTASRRTRIALGLLWLAAATGAAAQEIRFYEHDRFRGRSVTLHDARRDFSGMGFNDRASSALVRNGTWEVCSDARFGGRCVVLRPGRYASLGAMGLNDAVSSARPARRAGPPPRHDRRDDRHPGPPHRPPGPPR